MNILYPATFSGLTRLRVTRGGETIGWVSVFRSHKTDESRDEYFGTLAVGLLADCFAAPEHAAGVLAVGIDHLLDTGVDLIFSNQSHPAWTSALSSLGFLNGPSKFAFYRAPKVEAALEAIGEPNRFIHVNRGDCDGPRWS